jgi:putative nucleotidyltransferase with HDIG domain
MSRFHPNIYPSVPSSHRASLPSEPRTSGSPGSLEPPIPRVSGVSMPGQRQEGRSSDPSLLTSSSEMIPPTLPPRELTVDDLVEVFGPLVRSKTADLPVLPGVAVEALRLARDPRVRVDALLRVVEEDPPLAARILAVANSSFYARGIPIRSLRQAVVRLGLQPLRDVIYMAIYANSVFDAPGFVELVRETFDHCVRVGRIAQRLAPILGHDEESAFLAGLLHDVGQARCLKLFARHPLTRNLPRDRLSEAAERLHEAAGAALARAWNLPEEVVEACEQHHAPQTPFSKLIWAADAVSHELAQLPMSRLSMMGSPDGEPQAVSALVEAGLDPLDVPDLLSALSRELGGRVSAIP